MTDHGPSLTHHTLRGFMWMSSGKAAYAVMQLGLLAALGRLLTPHDFGIVSAALVVIAFSGIVSQLGLGPALVQRMDVEPRHVHTAMTASLLFGFLLGGITWLGAPFASGFFHSSGVEPVLRALAFVFPLQGLSTVAESLARRQLQFRWLATLDVKTYGIGYVLVALPMALSGLGVWALVAGALVEALARTCLLLARFRPPRGWHTDRRSFGELMSFGGGFTVAKIANFFATQGDNLMVGHLMGPSALGLYGRAYQLMNAPMASFGTVLDQVLFPAIARVQTEVQRVTTAYRRGTTLVALLIFPVMGATIVLAPEIILVVLGPKWTGVIAPFRVLALAMLFQNDSKIGDSLARAMGAVYRRAWRQVLYALFVVLGAFIGHYWGIVGVAAGVTLAITLNFVLMTQLSLSLTRLTWLDLLYAHVPGLLLATISSALLWAGATTLRHWGSPPIVVLGVTLTLAVAGALAVLWLWPLRFLGPDAPWMIEMLHRFKPKKARARPPSLSVATSYEVKES
jgi:O-antigen/teichoic acid export membrane protein